MMESLKDKMKGAILHSFRNTNQFLEVEFSNDTFEEIIFFIECKISSSDSQVNEIVNKLNALDKDVADITFFIPANNKQVINVIHESETLEVVFINGYSIYFHLYDDYGEPLSISFRRNKDENNFDDPIDFW